MAAIPSIGETWMVTIECLGAVPGFRFLDGQTHSGIVTLAKHTDPPFTGTRWAITRLADGAVRLRSLGLLDGPRLLDGVTHEHRVQLVHPKGVPFSGERWKASEDPNGGIIFECLGHAQGSRFLDGRTIDGTVALAPKIDPPFSGTRWRVVKLGKIVTLESMGKVIGPNRFLDGRTQDATVGMASMAAGPFTGTHWLLQEVAGGVTLMCLGQVEGLGRRFLDGRTHDGSVGLALNTDFPFTGTRWELVELGNPHTRVEPGVFVTLRCLGHITSPDFRFLDGRTHNSTVGLAPTTEEPFSGTRWRMLSPAIWYEPCSGVSKGLTKPGKRSAEVLSTVRVGQLTGRKDPEGQPLLNGDTTRWGVPGVDLGANCEHEGKLFIFFGDVLRGNRPEGQGPVLDADFIAFTDDNEVTPGPGGGLRIDPVLNGLCFDPFRVEGPIGVTRTFEVPSGAFSHAQQVFVFTHVWDLNHRDPKVKEGCYLVSKFHPFGPGPFKEEYLFSPRTIDGHLRNDQFGGVAPVVVRNADHPWLPQTPHPNGVVMFGMGYNPKVDYSAIQLAWVPLTGPHAPDLNEVRYFTDQEQPWDRDPQRAEPLFGELPNLQDMSAAFLKDLGLWIVIHKTGNNLNSISAPVIAHIGTPPKEWLYEFDLFDPCREGAYGKYMHWPGLDEINKINPLMMPGIPLPEGPACAYGGFLLERFTKWDSQARVLDLYYLLSLGSPYQVQVMNTKVRLE